MTSEYDDADPLVGQVLGGRYELESVIGHGGSATVYRGRQRGIGTPVAVKVLCGGRANDRFERELSALRRLRHPNTIRVLDGGWTRDGAPYLVTELLVGESLQTYLQRTGRLDSGTSVAICQQVVQSLVEAHAAGLIHRDLKPDNLFICRFGDEESLFVKVLDFGIAKLSASDGVPTLSSAGLVTGTPAYVAPEQALGRPIDGRCDVYAMGVLLYRMLQGRLPFDGDTPLQIVMKHIHETPVFEPDPEVPQALIDVVMWCLQKSPDDRPASIAELGRALAQIEESMRFRVTSASAPATSEPAARLDSVESLDVSHLLVEEPSARSGLKWVVLAAGIAGATLGMMAM